ncbi:hypothetical protein CSV79_08705 [Sporosarcina sp. P13]|uniref:glycosyltransferase family 2 protein n=1 Tax=Sporosarcina sp. P13 TaxID=2048263 RepID=UPI000C16FBCE|nr:glycosyltransferase [Sporosarcina sp. P13]PIC63990.1 hypothetical protein CSV79_08705 [Sporosarcina sp. P13]
MNDNIKVSVVIPVYNLEQYIERCIKSVINQNLKEIEIIIVNDGSSDNSAKIINKYQKEDYRIIAINQENSGVSSARNRGIEIATGEYITFVDGDDYINNTTLEEMYSIAESEKNDLVFCFLSNDRQKDMSKKTHIERSEICLKHMIEGKRARTASGILFKLSLLKRYNIKFETDLHYGEDFLFTIYSLIKTKKNVGIIPEYLYKVEERLGSATRKFDINRFKQISLLSTKIEDSFKEIYYDNELEDLLYRYFESNIFSAVTNIVRSNEKTSIKVKRLQEIKENKHSQKVFKYNNKVFGTKKNKLKVILIRYSNVYLIWILYSLYTYKRNDFK